MLKNEFGNLVTGDYPIFCHQVNCMGVMGSGIAKQIKDKYPKVFDEYKVRCSYGNNLGQIQTIRLPDNRICVNMFAQGYYGRDKRYTDYNAFKSCLNNLAVVMNSAGMSRYNKVAFPHGIGCGLAGGDWYVILGFLKDFSQKIKQDVVIVSLQ